jgi:RimJ/RimL family protein N-acetyltransferase
LPAGGNPPAERAGEERELVLRDGSRIVVRPVRAADRTAINAAFDRLSPESRYRRFLSSVDHLTEAQLSYLTDVDHHDHEALVAYDAASRDGVGVARFVRDRDDPAVAEASVVVDDRWQGRGLGTALCQLLAERAREEGVDRFLASLLATNEPMLHVIESLGPAKVVAREGATITVEVAVPREGIGDQMRGVLRAAARGMAELARIPGDRARRRR